VKIFTPGAPPSRPEPRRIAVGLDSQLKRFDAGLRSHLFMAEEVGFVGGLLPGDPEDVWKTLRRKPTNQLLLSPTPPTLNFALPPPYLTFCFEFLEVHQLDRTVRSRVFRSFAGVVCFYSWRNVGCYARV